MTIEALEDGVTINVENSSTIGYFVVRLNNDKIGIMSFYEHETEKEYNLINEAYSDLTTLNKGDKLQFVEVEIYNDTTNFYNWDAVQIHIVNGKAALYGKLTDSLTDHCKDINEYTEAKYNKLFANSTSLIDASKFDLGGINLTENCYNNMFRGCTSLTSIPILSADELKQSCYNAMFSDCTSLTDVKILPATKLAQTCYYYMFAGCTSLVNAPQLPATTLAKNCYTFMFSGCTSLVNAPKLPATTLVDGCYSNMFENCSSIKDIYFSSQVQNDILLTSMHTYPKFGAENADVHYIL